MNANAYRQILVARGEKDLEVEHGQYKYLIAFRTDLLKNKLVWTNDFRNDWHNYLKAKHPLYGVFKAPKCDAFSRKERGIVLFLGIGLAAIWSMIVLTATTCTEEELEDGCEDLHAFTSAGIGFSILGAIIKFAVNSILKMIATCGPCQKGCCLICKSFCECIGKCIMCMWTCIIVFMLIGFLVGTAIEGNLSDFLEMFVMTTLFAWFCTDLIMLSLKFCLQYGKEKKNVNGRLNALAVDYIEYEAYVNKCNLGYIAEIEKKLVMPRKNKRVQHDPGMPLLANSNPCSPQKVIIASANSSHSVVRIPMQNVQSQNVRSVPMQPKQVFVQSVQQPVVQQKVQYVQQQPMQQRFVQSMPQQRAMVQPPQQQQQQIVYVKPQQQQRVVYQQVVQQQVQGVVRQPLAQQQPQQHQIQKQQVNEEYVY